MLGPARMAGQRQGWVLTLAAWPWSRCSGDHVARSCGAFTGRRTPLFLYLGNGRIVENNVTYPFGLKRK